MRAAMAVAEAQLANVLVGTRAEVIAARKASWSVRKQRWCWRRRPLIVRYWLSPLRSLVSEQ
jgi:hypothetical protein